MDEMADRLAHNDYRFSVAAELVVLSKQFRMIRGSQNTAVASKQRSCGMDCVPWKLSNGSSRDEGNHSGEQGMDVQAVSSRNALLVTYPHRYAGTDGALL